MRYIAATAIWCLVHSASALAADAEPKPGDKLAELLILDDDPLPSGVTGGEVKTDQRVAPKMYEKMPKAKVYAGQFFSKGEGGAGFVSAFEYATPASRSKAYKMLVDSMSKKKVLKVDGIGEKAAAVELDEIFLGMRIRTADLVFQRGNYVVHVRLTEGQPFEDIQEFAKALDARLKDAEAK